LIRALLDIFNEKESEDVMLLALMVLK